ncbi:uncharacterized protein K441DRAFT_663518 [Cenococcum geophilum 1.58]|uniref:uncharacterized protein n=1 Tax=Cenococcum geophilum 1.58 TaxID=794803 RepID=UPI00358EA798|nr:hypothetical protein K441DRAFT_663518 [Cenococcum geophilum 1.58]
MEIEQGLEYFEDGKDCWLDFLIECRKGPNSWVGHTVRINSRESNDDTIDLQDKINRWNSGLDVCYKPRSRTEPLKKYLDRISSFNPKMRTIGKSMRIRTALDLAASVILLYGSPWLSQLRTCGMRYMYCDNLAVVSSCQTHNRQEEFEYKAAIFRSEPRHDCYDYEAAGRSFLLLAIALGELAIAAPLYMLGDGNPLLLKMGDKEVDRQEFLSVVVRMWGVKYKRAVEYCLEMDQKLRRRSLHPRDIRGCLETSSSLSGNTGRQWRKIRWRAPSRDGTRD